MAKGLFKGAVLGAVVIYLWMMVSWVMLPWHCSVLHKFTDEGQVREAIMSNTLQDGIYVLPNICNSAYMQAEGNQALKKGPMVFATIQRKGMNVDSPTPYIVSFIIQLMGAFLVTALFLLSKIQGYWRGVGFITLIGLTIAFVSVLPNWNWWGFSTGFVGLQIVDLIISCFLAGLVISAVAKRKN